MKKSIISVVTTTLIVIGAGFLSCTPVHAKPQVQIQFFTVPAPTSPNRAPALANIMNYMAQGWVVGSLDTNFSADPPALNPDSILLGCQICSGPAPFYMWDGTNNPGGSFTAENGSELAMAYEITDTSSFVASDVNFTNWSSDYYDTLGYGGNIATNTSGGAQLAYGSTLRGQVLDGTNVTADYHNGESVGNPVNRVFGVIRVSYSCANSNVLAADLAYFRSVMEITNWFSVTLPDGGGTNWISSNPLVGPITINLGSGTNNGTVSVMIEGQRNLPQLSYDLLRSFNLDSPTNWTVIDTNTTAGVKIDSYGYSQAFYRVQESGAPATHAVSFGIQAPPSPRIVVENGNE